MGRIVAKLIYPDGHVQYGIYCTTTDMMTGGRTLYDTQEMAVHARDVLEGRVSGVMPEQAAVVEDSGNSEPVEVRPYWSYEGMEDMRVFSSRADRRLQVLTGPTSEEAAIDERRQADRYEGFGPV